MCRDADMNPTRQGCSAGRPLPEGIRSFGEVGGDAILPCPHTNLHLRKLHITGDRVIIIGIFTGELERADVGTHVGHDDERFGVVISDVVLQTHAARQLAVRPSNEADALERRCVLLEETAHDGSDELVLRVALGAMHSAFGVESYVTVTGGGG